MTRDYYIRQIKINDEIATLKKRLSDCELYLAYFDDETGHKIYVENNKVLIVSSNTFIRYRANLIPPEYAKEVFKGLALFGTDNIGRVNCSDTTAPWDHFKECFIVAKRIR